MSQEQECFDQRLVTKFRNTIQEALEECPELRGCCVTLDFQGELNQAAKTGVWITRSGTYDLVEEVFGGLNQTGRTFAKQAEIAATLNLRMTQMAVELVSQEPGTHHENEQHQSPSPHQDPQEAAGP